MAYCLLAILALLAVIILYICYNPVEKFSFPPSMITSGDFHIQAPGAVADQGSFTSDMSDYMYGEGQGEI